MSETTKKTTTRRDLMGAAGFTALAGVAAAAIAKPVAQAIEVVPVAHDPDGRLLALCGRFLALQATIDLVYEREKALIPKMQREGATHEQIHAVEHAGEAERDAPYDEQIELLDQIGSTAAITLAGQQARARVLMAWYSIGKGGNEDSYAFEWRHLQLVFRDLLGVSA